MVNEEEFAVNKITIESKGSYFETDEEGFLINPASAEKIQEEWKPVVQDIIEEYKNHYGDKIKAIYIRGSVAKGEAIDNISDIDSFAYVDLLKEEISRDWTHLAEEKLLKKYPFIAGVEFQPEPLDQAKRDSIMLNQSLCVYGEPVEVPRLKIGKELMLHTQNFDRDLEKIVSWLEENHSKEEIKLKCVWIMRRILRVGFEITMERSKKYTRDLYRCYETFSEYYPEKESEMKEVLDYALNPTDDPSAILKIINSFGKWLSEEVKKF